MHDAMRRYKAGVFQALAHPTRIALVECLQRAELSVGQLCRLVGIEQANASQHLAVLRGKFIVQTRKAGNQTFYRLSDPLLGKVLEAMREFFLSHLAEAMQVLQEQPEDAPAGNGRRGARR